MWHSYLFHGSQFVCCNSNHLVHSNHITKSEGVGMEERGEWRGGEGKGDTPRSDSSFHLLRHLVLAAIIHKGEVQSGYFLIVATVSRHGVREGEGT